MASTLRSCSGSARVAVRSSPVARVGAPARRSLPSVPARAAGTALEQQLVIEAPVEVEQSAVQAKPAPKPRTGGGGGGHKGSSGPFAPLVVAVRKVVGEKEFNKLRGKAISLHSQVIKDFCKQVGVDGKQVQLVVRLAKKNGEWLGFLA